MKGREADKMLQTECEKRYDPSLPSEKTSQSIINTETKKYVIHLQSTNHVFSVHEKVQAADHLEMDILGHTVNSE